MDDPTKDTIPRSAVEYYLRKETVNTNPDAYESHERFIAYMDDPDISQFGHWMHSNGFNCALVSIAVDLDKIPSVTPSAQPGEDIRAMCGECDAWNQYKNYPQQEWTPCTPETMPKEDGTYLITDDNGYVYPTHWGQRMWSVQSEVVAWMPMPKPWKGR